MQVQEYKRDWILLLIAALLVVVLFQGVQAKETYNFVTEWGEKGTSLGEFNTSTGVAVDNAGNVYVADYQNNRIQKFTSEGRYVASWGKAGTAEGQFNRPSEVAVDLNGDVYVADSYNNRIQKFHPDGTLYFSFGTNGTGPGQFNQPESVTVDPKGNIYVTDRLNNRIQKFSSDGKFLLQWGSKGSGNGEFNYPSHLVVDSLSNVYVADFYNNRIQRFSADDGSFLGMWGSAGSGNGQFAYPDGLAVDKKGNIYVADGNNQRIQKFTGDGQYITQWGAYGNANGQFDQPEGIAVDLDGNVYVADKNNYRVQKFALKVFPDDTPAQIGITSSPTGVEISVDDVYKGIAPLTITGIAPGMHTFSFTKPGYITQSTNYTFGPGDSASMYTILHVVPPGIGTISVRSNPPGAVISLDGLLTGKTTPGDFNDVNSGAHTVSMSMLGYTTYTTIVTVSPGMTTMVNAAWTPVDKEGVVFITSEPSGAAVYIDDQSKGMNTPATLQIKPGKYILKLTKGGYKDNVAVLTVGSGEVLQVSKVMISGFEGILAVIALVAVVLIARKCRS